MMNTMTDYKDIEDIAKEHSIKDLGRISHAYQCGFTQGANYQKKIDIDKACEVIHNMMVEDFEFCLDNNDYIMLEFCKAMEKNV